MQITRYNISQKFNTKLAIVADSHGVVKQNVIRSLRKEKPDYILCPGDFFDRHKLRGVNRSEFINDMLKSAKELQSIAPFILAPGNHEYYLQVFDKLRLEKLGVQFLDNDYIIVNNIAIGGFSSNVNGGALGKEVKELDLGFLDRFEKLSEYKVLLSHHPEYYDKYLRNRNIDLVLSGHAHGGQIRIFGKGLFAPGQGPLPKLTSGRYDKMIISRGLRNTGTPVPRLFNPTELIYINL